MPQFLATYDLRETNPKPHQKFMENAIDLGWSPLVWGPKSQRWYQLPNTTVIGDFSDHESAVVALKDARDRTAAELGKCVMEKWIVARSPNVVFDSDEKTDAE